MDKYIGRLLDNRYEILEVIGTGGMAVVYKARCHRLNRLVAIKILKDDYLEDEEFRRRFHSESQAVAMLSHPNIVSIYDVSTSLTADYIVMELIDGITLKQYMEKKGVLNWKETLHFAIQIAKALEHAHSRGIVHRDIKPHNVMVLKNGSVKVTDFGIARMMSKGNTLTKEALGSVHYISPEQAKGGRVDSRSDIYSLGVVMYEMMSGRPPYDGESPVAVAIQHINGGAVMPSTLNPNIPGGLEQIIMKAMAHEPSKRYDSAPQMLTDLDEFRKNPAILFDYNTPPIDAVTKMPKPPLVLDSPPVKTTAERVERKNNPERRTQPRKMVTPEPGSRPSKHHRKEEKNSNIAIVAIICAFVAILVAFIVIATIYIAKWVGNLDPSSNLVTVPDLVGRVYEDLPDYPDFEIRLNERIHNDDVEEGTIIKQSPEANTEVEKPNTIYVTVSLGKAKQAVYMPNVVSWETAQAEKSLINLSLNLKITVQEEYHETVNAGSVIRTEPAEGVELVLNQEIVLYVSLGVEEKTDTMPNLVGDTEQNAIKRIESKDMKLKIEAEEIFDSVTDVGEVVRTEPQLGESLKTGQNVVLYISKGPNLKKMQQLVGLNVDAAVSLLKIDEFNNYQIEPVISDKQPGVVVEQSEAAETMVDVNTVIILKYSKGPITKTQSVAIPTQAELAECGITEDVYTAADGTVSFVITIKSGITTVYTSEKLDFSSGSISFTAEGAGTVDYDVYVNGHQFKRITVEFTE